MTSPYNDLSESDQRLVDKKHAENRAYPDAFNENAAKNRANGSRHPHDLMTIKPLSKEHLAQRLERLKSIGLSHDAIERNL